MPIISRFFPNGEFTQGVDTSAKRKKKEKSASKSSSQLDPEYIERYLQWIVENPHIADISLYTQGQQFLNSRGELYTYLFQDIQGHHYALEGFDDVYPDVIINEPIGLMVARGEMIPLGLSNGRILENPPQSRKKGEKMTSSMARNIRNACFVLEREVGKDNLSFLTLTLPSLPPHAIEKICKDWGKMVNKFIKWLEYRLQLKNISVQYVYCTEIQLRRLKNTGEYAPHLHIVFQGKARRGQPWAVTPIQCRKQWARCIRAYCDFEFDTSALENLQQVRKSAGGYLSKYLSKGAQTGEQGGTQQVGFKLVTHWGGMSRNLSKALKRAINRFEGAGACGGLVGLFFAHQDELIKAGLLKYSKTGFIEIIPATANSPPLGLFVVVGCLAKACADGGLTDCFTFLQNM